MEATSKPYPWILNPVIDLMLCCGGLVWVMGGLYFFYATSATENLEFFLGFTIILTHLFSNSHTAATLVRVYGTKESRQRFSFHAYWWALVCTAILVEGVTVENFSGVLLKIYVIWVIQHYTAQTYGISLIYCYKRGYRLGAFQKRAIWVVMNLTAAYAIARDLTFKDWGVRYFLFQEIPFWGPIPTWIYSVLEVLLIASVVVFVSTVLYRLVKERVMFPLPSLFVMVTGVTIFVVGGMWSQSLWLFVPALYHGSQYLVVTTSYYLKEKGLPEGVSSHEIGKLLFTTVAFRYLGFLILGGVFIYIGLPRILEELGIPYVVALGSVFAVFNFHHFLTDRAIWRIRDSKTREILIA